MRIVRLGSRIFNLGQVTHVVIEPNPAPGEPAAFLFLVGIYGVPQPISAAEWPILEQALLA